MKTPAPDDAPRPQDPVGLEQLQARAQVLHRAGEQLRADERAADDEHARLRRGGLGEVELVQRQEKLAARHEDLAVCGDVLAERIDALAQAFDRLADRRDQVASARDAIADARDAAAGALERDRGEDGGPASVVRHHAAVFRDDALGDRLQARDDRRRAAGQRVSARQARQRAAADRDWAKGEQVAARAGDGPNKEDASQA